jgi:D-glycero-alpha-D-manno-heptose-7-phosphate kinase
MIISRTPFRISFFGGGTDYPAWLENNTGAVLSTTIDKYCYISCRNLPPFFEHRFCLVYSVIEMVKEIGDIKHPAVRGILEWLEWTSGLGVHYDGDLPARSGLGSSSAFTVGLINALNGLNGQFSSKRKLAEAAIFVEQKKICETVGGQDQVAAAFGGFNRIDFYQDQFSVTPITINSSRLNELNSNLMLFFTGISRFSSDIAKTKVLNINDKYSSLTRMREMVDEAIQIMCDPNVSLREFGKLLHEGWELKKTLSDSVSTKEIDSLYCKSREAGAIGGKLLGAGGGGFLLLFVLPDYQETVRLALKELVEVPFRFEGDGSRIIFCER